MAVFGSVEGTLSNVSGTVIFLLIVFLLFFLLRCIPMNLESQLGERVQKKNHETHEGEPRGLGAWMLPRVSSALVAAPSLSTVCGSCP